MSVLPLIFYQSWDPFDNAHGILQTKGKCFSAAQRPTSIPLLFCYTPPTPSLYIVSANDQLQYHFNTATPTPSVVIISAQQHITNNIAIGRYWNVSDNVGTHVKTNNS